MENDRAKALQQQAASFRLFFSVLHEEAPPPVEVENLSEKYPGLTTRHRWFDAKVRLAAAAVQEQYIEEQPEKQTFFRWQSAEG